MTEAEPCGVDDAVPARRSMLSQWLPLPALPICPGPFPETRLWGENGQEATQKEEEKDDG